MASFQNIVVIIAVILLVIFLGVLAYLMHQANNKRPWPPTNNPCPDYYTSALGDGSDCVANLNVYGATGLTEPCRTGNFGPNGNYANAVNGKSPACLKDEWAATCHVPWDGITYGGPAVGVCNAGSGGAGSVQT